MSFCYSTSLVLEIGKNSCLWRSSRRCELLRLLDKELLSLSSSSTLLSFLHSIIYISFSTSFSFSVYFRSDTVFSCLFLTSYISSWSLVTLFFNYRLNALFLNSLNTEACPGVLTLLCKIYLLMKLAVPFFILRLVVSKLPVEAYGSAWKSLVIYP